MNPVAEWPLLNHSVFVESHSNELKFISHFITNLYAKRRVPMLCRSLTLFLHSCATRPGLEMARGLESNIEDLTKFN